MGALGFAFAARISEAVTPHPERANMIVLSLLAMSLVACDHHIVLVARGGPLLALTRTKSP